ncbi:MAG: hypothetical protein ACLQLH_12785 [Terracidiphilus sp.]
MPIRIFQEDSTVLLFVVKNPDNISGGGGRLWVKSGKDATVSH